MKNDNQGAVTEVDGEEDFFCWMQQSSSVEGRQRVVASDKRGAKPEVDSM